MQMKVRKSNNTLRNKLLAHSIYCVYIYIVQFRLQSITLEYTQSQIHMPSKFTSLFGSRTIALAQELRRLDIEMRSWSHLPDFNQKWECNNSSYNSIQKPEVFGTLFQVSNHHNTCCFIAFHPLFYMRLTVNICGNESIIISTINYGLICSFMDLSIQSLQLFMPCMPCTLYVFMCLCVMLPGDLHVHNLSSSRCDYDQITVCIVFL